MFKPYLKTIVRPGAGASCAQGLGIELFRLDTAEPGDLTEEEFDAAEEVEGQETGTALMRIYEDIGEDCWTGEGITAKKFAAELDGFGDIKRLHIHINSLGGDAFAAQAIHSSLKEHSAKKTSYIDGVAASAATIIACGANEVVARMNSTYMIHNPWGVVMGGAKAMRKAADDLDKVTKPIVNVYAAQVRETIDEATIRQLMDDETWMDAEEAKAYGFVNRIKGKIKAIAKVNKSQILCSGRVMNLDRYHYRNIPRFPTLKAEPPKAAAAQLKPEMKGASENMESNAEPQAAAAAAPKKVITRSDIPPELVAEIVANACSTERTRLAALDAMAGPGLDEIIAKAKADGKQPQDIALEVNAVLRQRIEAAEKKGAMLRDAAPAGAIRAGDAPPTPKPADPQAQVKAALKNAFANCRPAGSTVQAVELLNN